MCLKFEKIKNEPNWFGWTWKVSDQDQLAYLIALVAIGEFRTVRNIIKEIDYVRTPDKNWFYDQARDLLSADMKRNPGKLEKLDDPKKIEEVKDIEDVPETEKSAKAYVYLRDGWMFQIIAWIASVYKHKDDLVKAPHIQWAEKGLDGLIIELHDRDVAKVIICEEKASEKPEDIVKRKVWPEFDKFQKKSSNTFLRHEVSVLLGECKYLEEEETDNIIKNLLWENIKAYRISLPIEDGSNNDDFRKNLFSGYQVHVEGDVSKRRVETLELTDLREWMEKLAQLAIGHIDKMESDSHV